MLGADVATRSMSVFGLQSLYKMEKSVLKLDDFYEQEAALGQVVAELVESWVGRATKEDTEPQTLPK